MTTPGARDTRLRVACPLATMERRITDCSGAPLAEVTHWPRIDVLSHLNRPDSLSRRRTSDRTSSLSLAFLETDSNQNPKIYSYCSAPVRAALSGSPTPNLLIGKLGRAKNGNYAVRPTNDSLMPVYLGGLVLMDQGG